MFVTYKGLGTTGFYADWNHIEQNFFIANYQSSQSVDNDDGSAYYNTTRNAMLYGGAGMKSDFGGHDNVHHANVYAYSASMRTALRPRAAPATATLKPNPTRAPRPLNHQ